MHLYKPMNRCPICECRDFAVRNISGDIEPIYELVCSNCGGVTMLPRNRVIMKIIDSETHNTVGYRHWTKGDIFPPKVTHLIWDSLVVA